MQFQEEEEINKAREEFLGYLKDFTHAMDDEGPYFLGKDFMLPDIAFAPWATRLRLFDEFKGGLGIPEPGQGGEDERIWQRWRKWLDAVQHRSSVQNTLSEREYYLPVEKRYADNVAQSEAAKATRAGRGVP